LEYWSVGILVIHKVCLITPLLINFLSQFSKRVIVWQAAQSFDLNGTRLTECTVINQFLNFVHI